MSQKPIVNVIQCGAFGWVWGRFTEALKKHLDAQVLVSVGQIIEADRIIAMCPEYMQYIDPSRYKDTTCMIHHFEPYQGRTFGRREHLLRAAGQVVSMNGVVGSFLNSVGIQTEVIGYGIDCDKWTPTKPKDGLNIGVCGRNYASGRNNPNGVVEIAKRIASIRDEQTVFTFCGHDWEPVVEEINQIDNDKVIASVFNGEYEGYDCFYKAINCLLIASNTEGGPYPALEALASGRRVISTPVGFMPELNHECDGMVSLFKHGDYINAVKSIFENDVDPFECSKLIQHRSWENECAKWSKILNL